MTQNHKHANPEVASANFDRDAPSRTRSAAEPSPAIANPAAASEPATLTASVHDLQWNLPPGSLAPAPPGIGLVVEPDPDPHGHFVIGNVVEDSIAAKTGRLHDGDVIEAVDGVSVKGCTSMQLREWVVKELRKGVVTITVRKSERSLYWKQNDVLQVDLFAGAASVQAEQNPQDRQLTRRLPIRDLPEQVPAMMTRGTHEGGGDVGSAETRESWQQQQQCLEQDTAMRQKLLASEDACQALSRAKGHLEEQLREALVVAEREKQRCRSLEKLCDDKEKAMRQALQDTAQQHGQQSEAERQRELLAKIAQLEEKERILQSSMEQACAALEAAHEEEKRTWNEKQDKEREEGKQLSDSLHAQLEEEREAHRASRDAFAQEHMGWQKTLASLQSRLGQVVEKSEAERSKEDARECQLEQERKEELERQRAKSAAVLQETIHSEREKHTEAMQKMEQLRADEMQKHQQQMAQADAEKQALKHALDQADAEKRALRQDLDQFRRDLDQHNQLQQEYQQLQREHTELQQQHGHLQHECAQQKTINGSQTPSPAPRDMPGRGGAWQQLVTPEGKPYYFHAATNRYLS